MDVVDGVKGEICGLSGRRPGGVCISRPFAVRLCVSFFGFAAEYDCGKRAVAQFEVGIEGHCDDDRGGGGYLGGGTVFVGDR